MEDLEEAIDDHWIGRALRGMNLEEKLFGDMFPCLGMDPPL